MSFLVIGRDQDPAMPWLVSELADIYPVLETVDEFVVEANQASIAVDGQRMPPIQSRSRAVRRRCSP